MKIQLKDINEGDKVFCGGSSGFCHNGVEVVVMTSFKYDENTGEKYKVIHLHDNHQYDSRTGRAMNPPWAYSIRPTTQ